MTNAPRPIIEFPETVAAEWRIVADAAGAEDTLRERLILESKVDAELDKIRVRYQAQMLHTAEIEAGDTPELEMFTVADYKEDPSMAQVDLIDGVLNEDSLCLVLGPSKSGKSTLSLQMAYCMATGTDFLGQSTKALDGSVGILSYDMPGRLMGDWLSGMPSVDLARFSIVNAHKRGNPLAVPAQRAQIAAAWKRAKTEIVVIDSFGASFFGADQNDSAMTMAHYRDLKKFALTEVEARVVIVIVHATEASPKKPRGSTVHIDVADTIVNVWKPGGDTGESRHVEMDKYREMRGHVQMAPVVITAPDPVTRLVDVDLGGMALAGYTLPVGSSASAGMFAPLPEDEPDTTPLSEDEIREEESL